MKKVLFIFVGLLFAVMVSAQNRPVMKTYSTTLQGKDVDTIALNIKPGLEYVSLQFVPTKVGKGDSVDFSYIVYGSNTMAGTAYTPVAASATVSSTAADTDALKNFAPFQHINSRIFLTGISKDTVLVTVYEVQK
jgi:hypothetical protein